MERVVVKLFLNTKCESLPSTNRRIIIVNLHLCSIKQTVVGDIFLFHW